MTDAAPLPDTRAAERADVLAYLLRKQGNAEAIAAKVSGFEAHARGVVQVIEALVQDIAAGLHEGEVAVTEMLARPADGEPRSPESVPGVTRDSAPGTEPQAEPKER